MRELEETLGADEWAGWLAFHALYDLPDGFLVAGQLGALVANAVGGKGKPHDFAPYYKPPAGARRPTDLTQAFAFLRAHARHAERQP